MNERTKFPYCTDLTELFCSNPYGRADICKNVFVSRENIMPPAPEGAHLIHTRMYEVRTYKLSDEQFLLRGVVIDEKPDGLYLTDDPDPLWMHHMVVDLHVSYPMYEIQQVKVDFYERPHTHCTAITPDYQKLVGLSIARGFNTKVKELFGGPRGCTHIGALLAAMAPVAIQSGWSMRAGSGSSFQDRSSEQTAEQRQRSYAMNLNTCHMWAEGGDLITDIQNGIPIEIPLSVQVRLKKLGRPIDDWGKF